MERKRKKENRRPKRQHIPRSGEKMEPSDLKESRGDFFRKSITSFVP